MPGDVPKPCWIFRIVHFDNLSQIVNQGGIWCGNQKTTNGLSYKQIGLQGLTKQRKERAVPIGPGGNLNDYVPFYFCPRSIMLYQIHTGKVETYTEGQEAVIYLVTSVEKIVKLDLPYVFTDRHAKMTYAEFHEDKAKLSELDWPTIQMNNFARSESDPDRPTRKQAEFLVHKFVPLEALQGVGVFSKKWKDDCDNLFVAAGVEMNVKVHTKWFF